MDRHLLLSVQPIWADLIVEGRKTIELRRKKPKRIVVGDSVFIYSTSPEKKVIGYAKLKGVIPVKAYLAGAYSKEACCSDEFIDKYFEGLEWGYGLDLTSPIRFNTPIDIKEYGMKPQQSYRYISPELANQWIIND